MLYMFLTPIVNTFSCQVEAGEEVFLIKDGSSKTSIVVTNRHGVEVGYLKSDVAAVLTPLRDRKIIGIEGSEPVLCLFPLKLITKKYSSFINIV